MFCNSFRRQFVKLVETRICKPDFRKECQHLLATSTKGRQTSGLSEVASEHKCKITSKATLLLMEAQCFFRCERFPHVRTSTGLWIKFRTIAWIWRNLQIALVSAFWGKGRFPEKNCCSFGFCPNFLPSLNNLYTFFWTPKTSI